MKLSYLNGWGKIYNSNVGDPCIHLLRAKYLSSVPFAKSKGGVGSQFWRGFKRSSRNSNGGLSWRSMMGGTLFFGRTSRLLKFLFDLNSLEFTGAAGTKMPLWETAGDWVPGGSISAEPLDLIRCRNGRSSCLFFRSSVLVTPMIELCGCWKIPELSPLDHFTKGYLLGGYK